MFDILRKYKPFVDAGIKKSITYRIDFLLYRLGDIIGAIVTYFLWRAIFLSSSHLIIAGFSVEEMSIYVFLSFFTAIIISTGSSPKIGQEIKDGSISMRLLKPVSFAATYLFEEIGKKIVQVSLIIVPILGGLIVFQILNYKVIPFNGKNFFLFVLSSVIAYLLNFYFDVCFGFTAFVLRNLWGANVMKTSIVAFMSGILIPLAFFPHSVSSILQIFPFSSLIYTPVMVYLGKYSSLQLIQAFVLQIFWLLFFYCLSKVIWKFVINKLVVQGG